jgi:hypothetical protein
MTERMPLALLFPKARPNFVSSGSVASMVSRSMDSIPRDFGSVAASPIDCLLFPLRAIIADTVGYTSCTVSDLFDYRPLGLNFDVSHCSSLKET